MVLDNATVVAPLPAERPPAVRRRRRVPAGLAAVPPAAVLLVLTVIPVGFLVYGAFRTDAPGLASTWTWVNLDFLGSSTFLEFARNTLVIAALSSLLGFGLGLVLAVAVVRFNPPGARWLDTLIVVPAFVPPFLMALAWMLLLSPRIGYLNAALAHVHLGPLNIYTTGGIVWVMGLCSAPVCYLYIRPGLLAFDASLEEAAWVFGASRARTMRRIVLRLATPALLSSILVVFVTSLGEFGVPGVLGPQAHVDTISTALLLMVTEYPSDPNRAAVLGLTLMVVSAAGLLLNRRILKGRDFATVGSRGAVQRPTRAGRGRYLALLPCVLFALVAMVLPLAALVVGSLQPFLSPTFKSGWTLANYTDLRSYPGALTSIGNSLLLSVLAAVIGVLLAAWLARISLRGKGLLRRGVDQAATLPLAVPHVVFGLALLWMWIQLPVGLYGTKWILLVAYVGLLLPFGMRAAVAALQQIDPSLEEAGRMTGAGPFRVSARILLPLLAPALLSGATIILYHAMREISASLMLYTPGNEVMSIEIWNIFATGDYVKLFALSVLNIVLILLMVAVGNRLIRWLQRR
jgi:iron(III) transport system permease protein